MATATHPWLVDFPSFELTLEMEPEELAPYVLLLAKRNLQNGMVHTNVVLEAPVRPPHGQQLQLGQSHHEQVTMAVAEAFEWLRMHLLLVRDPSNGSSGWVRIGRRGIRLLEDPTSFAAFRRGVAFPKELLHPAIAGRVWIRMARGEFEDAVFIAFRAVEDAVRIAARYPVSMHGDPMLRAAFHHTNGPLTDLNDEPGERHALSNLFSGAYGSQRNRVAHRENEVGSSDAQSMVMLASYLLRVVDVRAANYRPEDIALPAGNDCP